MSDGKGRAEWDAVLQLTCCLAGVANVSAARFVLVLSPFT